MDSSNVNPLYTSISRRRALSAAGIGAGGLLSAALIGCSSTDTKKPADASRAPAAAGNVGADAKPKPGGTLTYAWQVDPDTLDPYVTAGGGGINGVINSNVYSGLFTFEAGVGKPASGKIIGDLAQTWEVPDPLTIVAHLNPKAKFDQKAPLNGRTVTSEDVVQSWKRLVSIGVSASSIANAKNKAAPVASIDAIDPTTVRIKLAFADVTAIPLLVTALSVQPTEGIAGKIDFAKEMRGSGPFLLDEYQHGVMMAFKRNPDWFGGPQRPYVDGIRMPILPDRAQMEVQFRSKKLHWNAVSRENLPQFAKDLPGTEVAVSGPNTRSGAFALSYLPGQPWHDIRVRRAVSMAMDRSKWADVLFNPNEFKALGVKLTVRWNAPIAGGYGSFWLDPQGKEFGPAAAYLQHDVAESKKLLAAAGYTATKPFEFDIAYPGTRYGLDYPTRVEVWQAMLKEAGIKANALSVDYTEYVKNFWQTKALFKGKNVEAGSHYLSGGASADPLLFFFNFMSADSPNTMKGAKFPEFDDMIRKQREVTDFETRRQGVFDLQRFATENMINIPAGPDVELTDLVWKELRGPQIYSPWSPTTATGVGASGNTPLFTDYWYTDKI